MARTNRKFIIFGLIGVFNTLFDIVLYVVVLNASGSIIVANIVATSAALVGSYLLNSRLTFKAKRWTTKSFLGFLLVTLTGLWLLQTALIYGFSHLTAQVPEHFWHLLGGLEKTAKSVAPKLIATAFTFIWNYLWYNKVIFKDQPDVASAASLVGRL